ncbi:lactate utilization protein C [Neomicrococcus aestuarii]|uniref:L-lactate dehydrogenase complex protein LldG n=1 Tax=Neomicrococcus aestuarii TaxID=556325 RepID=A0A1L2ZRJ4_9MICC|nr:lactate utilization protein C [Neomicrococcus aestuarii]MBB5512642.1 L-lactate dehydrogenase complex protein LldG [Neomicrococcus aestuarii]
MGAKEDILSRVRVALQGDAPVTDIPRDYRQSGTMNQEQLIDHLTDRLVDYKAEVKVVLATDLQGAIAEFLANARSVVVPHGLDAQWIAGVADADVVTDSSEAPVPVDQLNATDAVLTSSAVSVAESGTIILDGTPTQGRRAISLVPDQHVCVVPASTIVEILPEALPRLQPSHPQTWISGPSATSDIELERVEGVHGPRRLSVIIVEDA